MFRVRIRSINWGVLGFSGAPTAATCSGGGGFRGAGLRITGAVLASLQRVGKLPLVDEVRVRSGLELAKGKIPWWPDSSIPQLLGQWPGYAGSRA